MSQGGCSTATFPPSLSKDERASIHAMAGELEMTSVSAGVGELRQIIVRGRLAGSLHSHVP